MISELMHLIGWKWLEELALRLGGKRIYMPSNGRPPARLVKVLGEHDAEKIRYRWAGMRIDIPSYQSVVAVRVKMKQRDRASAMLAEGHSVRSISLTTGLSPRTIRRLR